MPVHTFRLDAPSPLLPRPRDAAAAPVPRRRRVTRQRVLVAALAISLAVHLGLSLWPLELGAPPEIVPLSVTLKEMPPPPKPTVVAAAPKPTPKPRRKRVARTPVAPPPPLTAPAPAPAAVVAEAAPAAEPAVVAAAPEPVVPPPPTEIVAPPASAIPELPPPELPARLDLAYTVFLGTQGFMIGDATYRFEHTGTQYRISTVGQARGLAALLIRGQGKIESRGLITPTGLQPQEFAIERGSSDRREVATFDWEAGVVTLRDQAAAPLELPTYDPLALMWQNYFSPPTSDQQSFNVATTRRVRHYTVTREGTEKIAWKDGEIDTERWHRRSDDGRTDGYVWLAPSLHYVPVKMRVVATHRGTVEALLDSIRVDEPVALQ